MGCYKRAPIPILTSGKGQHHRVVFPEAVNRVCQASTIELRIVQFEAK